MMLLAVFARSLLLALLPAPLSSSLLPSLTGTRALTGLPTSTIAFLVLLLRTVPLLIRLVTGLILSWLILALLPRPILLLVCHDDLTL